MLYNYLNKQLIFGAERECAMSSQIAWHAPDSVLFAELSGSLDELTLNKAVYYMVALMDEAANHSIHLILDMSATHRIMRHPDAIADVLAPLLRHPRRGWTLVICRHMALQGLLNKAVGGIDDWGYVSTLEEANFLLQRMDRRLPTLPEIRPGEMLYTV